jgi:hypothetical protein
VPRPQSGRPERVADVARVDPLDHLAGRQWQRGSRVEV